MAVSLSQLSPDDDLFSPLVSPQPMAQLVSPSSASVAARQPTPQVVVTPPQVTTSPPQVFVASPPPMIQPQTVAPMTVTTVGTTHGVSRFIYIGILILTFLIILGFLLYLIFARSNQSGVFAKGPPQIGEGLIFFNANADPKAIPEITPAQQTAIDTAKAKAKADLDVALTARANGDSRALIGLFFTKTGEYGSDQGNAASLGGGKYTWPNTNCNSDPCCDLTQPSMTTPCSQPP